MTADQDPNLWLAFEHVTLERGGRTAFADTNWEVRRGEQWAIVGPNASGKSLLVAALAGRVRPREGHVRHHFVEGAARIDAAYGYFRPGTLAVVSTHAVQELADALSPYHQARWHGSFGGASPSVDEMLASDRIFRANPFEVVERPPVDPGAFDARRAAVVELLGIESLLLRKLVQLSSGEVRKFLLARAVLTSPRLLVLDEPFVGLDAATRAAMPAILDALIATGLQLVIATARPAELPPAVDHVLVVRELGVVYSGPRANAPAVDDVEANRLVVAPSPSVRRPRSEFSERIPIVEIHRARVAYGSTVVLDDVDFSVHSDENWAVLGPNGAGKTALCSLILADNPQSYANDVVLFGRRRGSGESIWDVKSKLGWVAPEIVAHYPRGVSCFDVVCSGWFHSLGVHRRPTDAQLDSASHWLQRFGLSKHADQPLGSLSHGEQRLVLVARALVSDPWLLVLDEPCQGLDLVHRTPLLAAVDEAAAEGRSRVVYVTHHLDELPRCITHELELRAGRVVRAERRASGVGVAADVAALQ